MASAPSHDRIKPIFCQENSCLHLSRIKVKDAEEDRVCHRCLRRSERQDGTERNERRLDEPRQSRVEPNEEARSDVLLNRNATRAPRYGTPSSSSSPFLPLRPTRLSPSDRYDFHMTKKTIPPIFFICFPLRPTRCMERHTNKPPFCR